MMTNNPTLKKDSDKNREFFFMKLTRAGLNFFI